MIHKVEKASWWPEMEDAISKVESLGYNRSELLVRSELDFFLNGGCAVLMAPCGNDQYKPVFVLEFKWNKSTYVAESTKVIEWPPPAHLWRK